MKLPDLTPRLRLLADWVPEQSRLADIGTDHGYLPAYLLASGKVSAAIASDLRPEPLARAQSAGIFYGVSNIDYRLCDGLSAIAPQDCDVIVIAGMGGENIAAILAAAPWTRDGQHRLLLQPVSRAHVLRRFLAENGYAVQREALAQEKNMLYPVLQAVGGSMTLRPGQDWGGIKLLHDPLGDRYLIQQIIRLQKTVASLHQARTPQNQSKADSLRDILTSLLSMREEWRYANCP